MDLSSTLLYFLVTQSTRNMIDKSNAWVYKRVWETIPKKSTRFYADLAKLH